jgi:hypothetical protein
MPVYLDILFYENFYKTKAILNKPRLTLVMLIINVKLRNGAHTILLLFFRSFAQFFHHHIIISLLMSPRLGHRPSLWIRYTQGEHFWSAIQ